jgi:hypothetical protein
MCNGTHKKNDFHMKMELRHCKTPPTIHLDLIYGKQNINKHTEMKDGLLKISSRKTPLGTIPIDLKLTLTRKRNIMTTGVSFILFKGIFAWIILIKNLKLKKDMYM